MEKGAEEWRQIYKSLQLLEFLVKNGSERVVDYARSHVSVIEMLKNFHYINSEGKDQGINVRNRANELTLLLNDVNKIRAARKNARANKAKYSGIGSGSSGSRSGGFGDSGKKYGGFGGETDSSQYGAYSGGVYGDGGGFGGSEYEGPGFSHSGRSNAANDDDFEEYEAAPTHSSSSRRTAAAPPTPSKTVAPQADLFSFDDVPTSKPAAAPSAAADDDDEFADFQSATPVAAPSQAASLNTSKPLPASQSDNLFDLFSNAPASSFTSPPVSNNTSNLLSFGGNGANTGSNSLNSFTTLSGTTSTVGNGGAAKKAAKDDAFGSLWASAASQRSTSKPSTPSNASGASKSGSSLI